MTKKHLGIFFILSTISLMSFKNLRQININKHVDGSFMGNVSGAPTDYNCFACHYGNTKSGNGINILKISGKNNEITEYMTDTVYTVELTMNNVPIKKGFEAVALDQNNNVAGIFTELNDGNTKVENKRIHHTEQSSASSVKSWKWLWNTPNQNVGPITFYVSSLSCNNDTKSSNDTLFLSQTAFNPAKDAGISNISSFVDKLVEINKISINTNNLKIDFSTLISNGTVFVNITESNGQSVYYSILGKSIEGNNERNINYHFNKNTTYIVNIFVNNYSTNQKFRLINF